MTSNWEQKYCEKCGKETRHLVNSVTCSFYCGVCSYSGKGEEMKTYKYEGELEWLRFAISSCYPDKERDDIYETTEKELQHNFYGKRVEITIKEIGGKK